MDVAHELVIQTVGGVRGLRPQRSRFDGGSDLYLS